MSRKEVKHKHRAMILEPKHKNPLLSKFIRMLMLHGKMSVAERIVYSALGKLEAKTEQSGLDVFLKALNNVRPVVKVKARRVGGATYQVPVNVPEETGMSFAMRWIIAAARKRSGPMDERLYNELLEAYEERGNAVRKKEETHKMAEANKAFAHFRV